MDTVYTTVDQSGYVLQSLSPETPYQLNLTPGYQGPVAVVIDQFWPYNSTTWYAVPRAC